MKIELRSDKYWIINDDQFIIFNFQDLYHMIDYDREFDPSLIDSESIEDMMILKIELRLDDLIDFIDIHNEIERLRRKSGPIFDSDLDSVHDDLLNEESHRSIRVDLDKIESRIDQSRNSDSEIDLLNQEIIKMNRVIDYLRSEIQSLKS